MKNNVITACLGLTVASIGATVFYSTHNKILSGEPSEEQVAFATYVFHTESSYPEIVAGVRKNLENHISTNFPQIRYEFESKTYQVNKNSFAEQDRARLDGIICGPKEDVNTLEKIVGSSGFLDIENSTIIYHHVPTNYTFNVESE